MVEQTKAPENVLRQIQKLRVMAERGGGAEGANARRILDRMLEKYGIVECEMQARTTRKIVVNHVMVTSVSVLANSLGLNLYKMRRGNKTYYAVEANDMEYEAFDALFVDLKALFQKRWAQAVREAAGYVYGYACKCYPDKGTAEAPKCPLCESDLKYEDDRWQCTNPDCRYKGTRSRKRASYIDSGAASAGFKDGALKLTGGAA